jgi:hypothetical protein
VKADFYAILPVAVHRWCVVGNPDITENCAISGLTDTRQIGKTDAKSHYCEAVVFALSAGL